VYHIILSSHLLYYQIIYPWSNRASSDMCKIQRNWKFEIFLIFLTQLSLAHCSGTVSEQLSHDQVQVFKYGYNRRKQWESLILPYLVKPSLVWKKIFPLFQTRDKSRGWTGKASTWQLWSNQLLPCCHTHSL